MDTEDVLAVVGMVLLVLVIVVVPLLFANASCQSKWPSKYHAEFGLISGCTIEVDGDRIPASNYRVM